MMICFLRSDSQNDGSKVGHIAQQEKNSGNFS